MAVCNVTRIEAEGFGLPSGSGLDLKGGLWEPKSCTLLWRAGRRTRKGAVVGAVKGRQTHLQGAEATQQEHGQTTTGDGEKRESELDEGLQEALFMI